MQICQSLSIYLLSSVLNKLKAAYKHVQLELEFRPEARDGILLLAGERDDLQGDFMALILHHGFIEFR